MDIILKLTALEMLSWVLLTRRGDIFALHVSVRAVWLPLRFKSAIHQRQGQSQKAHLYFVHFVWFMIAVPADFCLKSLT